MYRPSPPGRSPPHKKPRLNLTDPATGEVVPFDTIKLLGAYLAFGLTPVDREEWMLAMNPKILQNLCESVRFSQNTYLVNFFKTFCDNYKFWVKRFQHDFPDEYEETMHLFYKNLINDFYNYSINDAKAEDLYIITPTGLSIKLDSNKAQRKLLKYWTSEYNIQYGLLYDLYDLMIEENKTDRNIRRYLRLGMDPNNMISIRKVQHLIDEEGITDPTIELPALNVAILYGNDRFVEALLDYGADPNLKDTYRRRGRTALHEAVMIEDFPPETIEKIIDLVVDNKSTNLDVRDGSGDTALLIAARTGDEYAAQKLLEAGANPKIQKDDGTTAMSAARDAGYLELAEKIERFILTGVFSGDGSDYTRSGSSIWRAKNKAFPSTRKVDKLQEWLE